jgi:hypothetical protein
MKHKSIISVLALVFLILGFAIASSTTAQDTANFIGYSYKVTTVSITDIVNGNDVAISRLRENGVPLAIINQIQQQFVGKKSNKPTIIRPLDFSTSTAYASCSPNASAFFTHGAGSGTSRWKLSNGFTTSGVVFTCTDTTLGCATTLGVTVPSNISTVSNELTNSNWISLHFAWCG